MADPETVYERPATTFVAGFIGVSNLMPGEVVTANGGAAELRLDAGPTVRTTDALEVGAGQRAYAVVRPEKLLLQDAGDSSAGRASVEGQVESSLYLGTATQMVVRLGDDTRMTVLVPNADVEERRELPAPGEPARLSWSEENIHVVREARGGPLELDTRGGPGVTDIDRELERLLRDPLTRRRLFRRGGAAAFGLSALGYLAACGPKTGGVAESAGDRAGHDRRGQGLGLPHLLQLAALHRGGPRAPSRSSRRSTAPRSSTSRRSTTTSSSSARCASSTRAGTRAGATSTW